MCISINILKFGNILVPYKKKLYENKIHKIVENRHNIKNLNNLMNYFGKTPGKFSY